MCHWFRRHETLNRAVPRRSSDMSWSLFDDWSCRFTYYSSFPKGCGYILKLSPGGHFPIPQLGKTGNTWEFLLFWNGHPSFFGRVLGPLTENPETASRYEFFMGPYYRDWTVCNLATRFFCRQHCFVFESQCCSISN